MGPREAPRQSGASRAAHTIGSFCLTRSSPAFINFVAIIPAPFPAPAFDTTRREGEKYELFCMWRGKLRRKVFQMRGRVNIIRCQLELKWIHIYIYVEKRRLYDHIRGKRAEDKRGEK